MDRLPGSTGKGTVFGRDWTKGSVIRNIFLLSWPLMISEGVWAVIQTVEMIWIGRLGAVSLAGVGVATFVFMLAMAVNMGLIEGVKAMVARFVGAGDFEGANCVVQQALIVSTIFSLIVMAIGFFLSETILSVFGLEADVIAEGTNYLRIILVGWLPIALFLVGYYVMQASGDTVTPMRITILFGVFQAAVAPFLIFGWWVFPRLGVSGAALSYVFSFGVGAALLLLALSGGRSRLQMTLSNLQLDFNLMWRIVKIGIPASIMRLQRPLGNLVFSRLMASFGTTAVAAHGLLRRVEQMLLLPGTALGAGGGVLVGQNLGADQPQRAERSGWLVVMMVEVFVSIASVGILIWAEEVIGIFTTEPELLEVGGAFLRIAIVGYLMTGFSLTLQQCLTGAGDTLPAMLFSLGDLWVVRLPLAFYMPRVANLGVFGVRWAIVIGLAVGGVAYILYFRMDRWKRKKV